MIPKLKAIELFSGSGIFSSVARELGFETFTIDIEFESDFQMDILEVTIEDFPYIKPTILWASPPCFAFSVASMFTHWDKFTKRPKTERGQLGLDMLEKTIQLIGKIQPKYWFIENPRGMMRNVIDRILKRNNISPYIRRTVTYCQYGDARMKPTDIWTNCMIWNAKPMCKNGFSCHESAPRGSKTGTIGLKDSFERSKLPRELCVEILELIKKGKKMDVVDLFTYLTTISS